MDIYIGMQLCAPNGYKMLSKDVIYYFLRSDANLEQTILVEYLLTRSHRPKKGNPDTTPKLEYRAVLTMMPRCQFESALKNEIVAKPEQSTLPPWLKRFAESDLNASDEGRRKPVEKHSDRINRRMEFLQPLLERKEEILKSPNPAYLINKFARECKPQQHPGRLCLWFFTYILFGHNKKVLHYNSSDIGRWKRSSVGGAKRGTPSIYNGKNHGYNVDDDMRVKIIASYDRFARQGCSKRKIYRDAMQTVFKCKVLTDKNGYKKYYHPDGEPFPSENQFFYVVGRTYGQQVISKIKVGPGRTRTELAPSKGQFTEAVTNLMEKNEADGYYFVELPKGLLEGSTLPPLCMVRIRDVTSGMLVGVGFSLGAERAAAYRMALFCAAIDKVKFCSLFGIQIASHQWPSIGLPANYITDRGVGATSSACGSDIQFRPKYRELAPAYSGQSKAGIETSHLKTTRNEDAPSYIQSNLTPVAMIKREILRTMNDNDCMNVQSRVTPDLVNKVRKPTPNAMWLALSQLGRCDANRISFDDAVRAFLSRVDVNIKADGVFLAGRRYDSDHLRATKLLDKVARTQMIVMKAYHLEGCVRYIWIQLEGQLIELEMRLALRVRDENKNLSLEELRQWEEDSRRQRHLNKEHVNASTTEMHKVFQDQTGKKFDGGTKKKGRAPRKTANAQREFQEARSDMEGTSS